MTIPQLYQLYLQHPTVTTDTRSIKTDSVFFALKGNNFNGNTFAAKALELGAAYVVIDEPAFYINEKTILVTDVLTTLQQLAKHHRQQFTCPFIAITGSNGKTTSKELLQAVLATTYITYYTYGNLNNHIGVPLTLLSVQPNAQMVIIEMGANHQKEIESYCQYTLPTHGVITNCGKAHLEGFGGVEGVKKGKGELFDYLKASSGTAFIYNDYDYLQTMSTGIIEIFTYGTLNANIVGTIINAEPFLQINFLGESLQTNLVGSYNLPNVLMAIAIGTYFKVAKANIFAAIAAYTPSNSRSQLVVQGTNNIILDAYNANPSSMALAISNIANATATNKVLVLGAMAELGSESIAEHQQIINQINTQQWHTVALVGGDFCNLPHRYNSFKTAAEAALWYQQQNFTNCTILIKGSRSMAMEKVVS